MSCTQPMFMLSPYFIEDEKGWHLKPGAPQDVIDDYEEFMREEEGIN